MNPREESAPRKDDDKNCADPILSSSSGHFPMLMCIPCV